MGPHLPSFELTKVSKAGALYSGLCECRDNTPDYLIIRIPSIYPSQKISMPLTAHDLPSHLSYDFRIPHELLKRDDVTLSDLYHWNAKENANYPLFHYHDPATAKNEYITYSAANEAFNRSARYLTHSVGRESTSPTGLPVIAILANTGAYSFAPRIHGAYASCKPTDTVTYFCTALGAFRAGFCAFLISTRNAPSAVADMLKRTGSTHLVVSPDVPMSEMADAALKLLAADGVEVGRLGMPSLGDLFPEVPDKDSLYEKEVELPTSYNAKAFCLMMHSSGTLY